MTATAGGPAPRLDAWRTIEFWRRPSLTTPFNVTGGPALAQCIGFSGSGLPLSMQVVGRPFDDATVLRVAHAYEHGDRSGGPVGRGSIPKPEFSTALPPIPDPGARGYRRLRPATGPRPPAEPPALACPSASSRWSRAAAPYVEAMTGRLYRERSWAEEPANIFQFGG